MNKNTKIESILDEFAQDAQIVGIDFTVIVYNDAVNIMQKYAEIYAKKCLEKAAEQVTFQYGEFDVEGFPHKEIVGIDYDSILNIKLPEHD